MHNIVIYTEGGLKLGLGNVYRMLELAKSIIKRSLDTNISFATSSDQYVVELIAENGFEAKRFAHEELISNINQLPFSLLIIDKLNIEKRFVSAIQAGKKDAFKTVIFGNLSDANQSANLVVNAIIGTDFSNRDYTDELGTHYLTGPKFLTLRDEFEHRVYKYKSSLKNILLLFGGSDQANLSLKVLKDFVDGDYFITVIIGRGYIFLNDLEAFARGKHNVKILRDIDNVKEIMLQNDFLITSPGTAMFEGFFLGLPVLALFQNESQKEVFRNFFMTNSYSEITDIKLHVKEIYQNIDGYYEKLNQLKIGEGKKDIVNQIIKLI